MECICLIELSAPVEPRSSWFRVFVYGLRIGKSHLRRPRELNITGV